MSGGYQGGGMSRSVAILALLLLSACGDGPTRDDMRGCATSNRQITARDVADCAVERAARDK